MALQKNLQDKIDPQNPYRAYAESFKWSAPTTKLIDKMSNWDMQNRGMNIQEAAQKAYEALNFYDLPGGMPDVFTPENPLTAPMSGAMTSYGRVPAPLYQSAIGMQDKLKSNEAMSNFAQQLQSAQPEGLSPMLQVALNAISQNPETLSSLIDPVFQGMSEVHQTTQQANEIQSLARELGLDDTTAKMLTTKGYENIAQQMLANKLLPQQPTLEDELKLQKLKADIDKTKADTAYTKERTGNSATADDDEKFIKEFRARYQSYLNELRSSNMPTVPMSEAEFAKKQGKEVYDRYNKILNPARGESVGIPSGNIIQQAQDIMTYFNGDMEQSILGAIMNKEIPKSTIQVLVDKYNEQNPEKPISMLEWLEIARNQQINGGKKEKGYWRNIWDAVRNKR